jgi:MoaA/NifB/PqqE/SkfB family radical SAM enzyme
VKKLILSSPGNFFKIISYTLKWHINYSLRKKNKPLIIGVFLTNRCNLRCSMCSIWRAPDKKELNLDDIKKIVNAVSPGCVYFSFSGGEPLLVKNIYEMIAYAALKIPYVHLVSNGILIDTDVARRLAKSGLSEISLSLDGDEKYHNNLRGDRHSFLKVIQAIENIRRNAPRINIVLNTVIFPGHLNQVRYVVELAKKLKIYAKVQPVNPHFYFSGMQDLPPEIEFEKVDRKEILDLTKYLLKNKCVLNSKFYLKNIPNYFAQNFYCPLVHPLCRLPYYFLEANPYRVVSPCMFGTGWEEGVSIEEYATLSDKFVELQKKLETCRKCDESMYICYWEALINLPLKNFIKYNLF